MICPTCADALDPTSCLTLAEHVCERGACRCRCLRPSWDKPDPALARMVHGSATFELRTARERDRIARVAANQTEWEDTDQ